VNGIPIGRVLGFEIRIHLSWVLILALVAVVTVGQLEEAAPDAQPALRWLVGALIAAAFLISVLAHELGHGLVARHRGLETGPITLFFFGGSTALDHDTERPADEAAVAVAGPLVSVGIGLILGGGALALSRLGGTDELLGGTAAAMLTLAVLNLLLGGINLVPGYPLDGGRILRAVVWARSGDRGQATRSAAAAGRAIGWALVGAGLVIVLTGDTTNGIMLGLSGWFLGNAARAVVRQQGVEDLLRGVTIGEVMERDVPSIPSQLTVDTFAERLFGEATDPGASVVPVVRDDAVVGVIGPTQLRSVGRASWATTRAEDLMVDTANLPALRASDSVWSGLDRLRRTGLDGLPVTDASGILGMLTRRAVVRTIQAQTAARGGGAS
jgi:Zn-dependent protease/predicted transcriptional regulator